MAAQQPAAYDGTREHASVGGHSSVPWTCSIVQMTDQLPNA